MPMLLRSFILRLLLLSLAPAAMATDVLTQRYTNERTGSVIQHGLTQATVADPRWGERAVLKVHGVVYAQPLYVEHVAVPGSRSPLDLVFVASGANDVAAFDAHSFRKIWETGSGPATLGPNDLSAIGKPGCDGISLPGGIGIEATPVIDPARNLMYVSYRTNPVPRELHRAQQRLRAIDIRTGRRVLDVPVLPPGVPADWTIWHRSRASLLLSQGVVYLAFASRCEDPGTPAFHGWILGYDAVSLRQVAAYAPTLDTAFGPIVDGGGIWQAAVGLAADKAGRIYAATGNRRRALDQAPADAPNLADSIIKLTPVIRRNRDGSVAQALLRLSDYFTPYRRLWMDDEDLDLAAAGPVLVPDRPLLIGGGKTGMLYLLDREDLGKLDTAHAWTGNYALGLPPDAVHMDPALPSADEDFAADHVLQKFQAGINQYTQRGAPELAHAGAPVAVALQGATQLDAFSVGRGGALQVYWRDGNGIWTDGTSGRRGPQPITPAGFAPDRAHLTSATQGPGQLDAFVVGHDGALHVTREAADGHWSDGSPGQPGPARITPTGLAPPGAPVAAAHQGNGQLDAFVVGHDGALHVTWVEGSGRWSDGGPGAPGPARITPTGLMPAGAHVATGNQGPEQLDAFAVGKDGAMHVTWVVGAGRWADGGPGAPGPALVTPAGFAPPGAPLAVANQGGQQLDAFVVGHDGAAYVSWVVGAGHWTDGSPGNPAPVRITPTELAPPGACITAAAQNDGQLDVFLVGQDGAAYVTWVMGAGHWADGSPGNPAPARITPPGVAPPGSCVAAIRTAGSSMSAFVTGNDGGLWWTWESDNGRWRDQFPAWAPVRLNQAVWMRGCWPCWPHIHGSPVYAAFPRGQNMLYVWPEKDHLKGYRWQGDRIDAAHPILGSAREGPLVLAPPGPPFGMPGGMLAVAVDPDHPGSGVLFGSVPRAEGTQMQGLLRAFDPFTLKELWNSGGRNFMFSKFVPPTLIAGRVFLPTGDGAVIVYGLP